MDCTSKRLICYSLGNSDSGKRCQHTVLELVLNMLMMATFFTVLLYCAFSTKLQVTKADRHGMAENLCLEENGDLEEKTQLEVKQALRELTLEEKEKLEKDVKLVTEFKQNKLEKEAQKNWDLFYKRNTTKFFKDRHWTTREFSDLVQRKVSEI